jgi:hypothetical protein
MLDGLPYASLHNETVVVADPDPNSLGGVCVRTASTASLFVPNAFRIALPTVVTGTLGVACRQWFNTLPGMANERPTIIGFQRSNLEYLVYADLRENGAIRIFGRVGGTNNVQVANSVNPLVSPSSWNHYEMVHNVGTGEGSLYINGVQKLTWSGIDTGLSIENVNFSANKGLPSGDVGQYIKDLVIWDGTGTQNNSVMGTVLVKRLRPNADGTLGGWTPSYGTNGHPLLRNSIPFNHLIATGTPNTSDNIRIGNTYYQFTTGNVNAGTPAGTSSNPWLVNRGSNAQQALSNLFKAINASGTPGTDYSTALTAHPTVEANGLSEDRLSVEPRDGTSSVFNFSAGDTNLSWLSGSNMITDGRPNDLTYMSAADNPLPSPMRFEMEDLPPDITSVRALISVIRHRKIDGGDGNVQTALSPNGTNWDNGADRPITTAFQYDFDVSEISPATGSSWTPVEVDNLKLRIDRTL